MHTHKDFIHIYISTFGLPNCSHYQEYGMVVCFGLVLVFFIRVVWGVEGGGGACWLKC